MEKKKICDYAYIYRCFYWIDIDRDTSCCTCMFCVEKSYHDNDMVCKTIYMHYKTYANNMK